MIMNIVKAIGITVSFMAFILLHVVMLEYLSHIELSRYIETIIFFIPIMLLISFIAYAIIKVEAKSDETN